MIEPTTAGPIHQRSLNTIKEYQMEWMPIEMGPTDGTRVLLYCPTLHEPVHIGYYRDHQSIDHGKITYEKKGWTIEGGMMMGALEPSHWCPFPDGP
jgi:hypothetical protein